MRTQINHGCCKIFKSSIISFNVMFRWFKFNPNYVIISCPEIILYLTLSDSSTWHFHVTTFIAISAVKVKSTLTLILVVIVPACMCHCIKAYLSGCSFSIRLPIKIVEIHPLSNRLRKALKFDQPCLVFVHPFIIVEWQMWFFVCLFRKIDYTMYQLAYSYFIYFFVIYTYHIILIFNPICNFMFALKLTLTSFNFYYYLFKPILSTWYWLFSSYSESKHSVASLSALTFCVSCRRI